MSPPFESDGTCFFRRAVGFTIKLDLKEPHQARVIMPRHGKSERTLTFDRRALRQWMALDAFTAWPMERALLETLEAHDLVYYADTAEARRTSGAPLGLAGDTPAREQPAEDTPVALRDGVATTVAVADDDEIKSWMFMPRRGAFQDKRFYGVRFSSLEKGLETYHVDLYADRLNPLLRALLPLLDGRRTPRDLEAMLGKDARVLLVALDDCALLSSPPARPLWPESPYVAWLGHAGVLVRVGNKTVLFDPLFIRRSQPPRPFLEQPFDWRTLPPIDAIAVTHADNDHLNPGSLVRLPPNVPVLIPALAAKHPYQVDFEAALGFLGFSELVPLADWQSHALADVRVTAVPFAGEDWGLTLQKATYLVEGPGGRVYLSADSLNPPEVFDAVKRRGPVDFAFLGVSGCAEPLVAPPGFGYGEFYAVWLPRAKRNQWQRFTQGPKEAALAAERLAARFAFGYAAGGGSFMDMAHADEGSHQELAARLAAQGSACQAVALALGEPFPLAKDPLP